MKKFLVVLAALVLVALPVAAQTTYTALAGSTFFTAADATKTQTATVIIPNRSANGNLMVTTTGITGSPSGCALAMYSLGTNSATAPSAAEQTPSITINTGTHAQVVAALSAGDITADQIKAVYACSTYPTAGTVTISFAPLSNVSVGALTITTPAQVSNYNSTHLNVNKAASAGTTLGALANYGTSPGAVAVESVNGFVTNTVATNITQVGGSTQSATHPLFITPTDGTNAMGAMVNYGSTPTAVPALSANVYVTNAISVATTGDPCLNPNVTKSSVQINTSGAGTTQLVGISASTKIYVCQVAVAISATTATMQFEYGGSTTCTGPTVLTGAMVPTAGGYYSLGWGGTIFTSGAGTGLCIVNGGAGTQIGFMTYVQQ
jgi:hypothetical protein